MYYENFEDLARAWLDNEFISSVQVGGIGPGYEQVIQVAVYETLSRVVQKYRSPLASLSSTEFFKTEIQFTNEKHELGMSGAQFAAASMLLSFIVEHGHEALPSAEQTRRLKSILVSRNFPVLKGA